MNNSNYLLEEKPNPIVRQLDQVELLTVKRVKWLSTKPGYSPSPHGIWSVVGIIDGEALVAKDDTLIRIPLSDIRKAHAYDRQQVIDRLTEICKGRNNGKKETIK
ncbi:MAG: hypothetical protein M0R50_08795 [Candidatus Cloacimonetes bacterium]|jgi:hypothetical protein|nr:hypothetical protein [Candidatus Cloacimonadota bacterium]